MSVLLDSVALNSRNEPQTSGVTSLKRKDTKNAKLRKKPSYEIHFAAASSQTSGDVLNSDSARRSGLRTAVWVTLKVTPRQLKCPFLSLWALP